MTLTSTPSAALPAAGVRASHLAKEPLISIVVLRRGPLLFYVACFAILWDIRILEANREEIPESKIDRRIGVD